MITVWIIFYLLMQFEVFGWEIKEEFNFELGIGGFGLFTIGYAIIDGIIYGIIKWL
jgi:hypothetical protein